MNIKQFFGLSPLIQNESEILNEYLNPNMANQMSGDPYSAGLPDGNFIGDSFYDTGGVFGNGYRNPGILEIERGYILHQRSVSMYPEVAIGIEEIMKDLYDKQDPMRLKIPTGFSDTKDGEELLKHFKDFSRKPFTLVTKSKTPNDMVFFNLIRQAYIDGFLVILASESKETKKKLPGSHLSMVHGYDMTPMNESSKSSEYSESDIELLQLLEASKTKKSPKESKIQFTPLDPAKIILRGNQFFYEMNRTNQIYIPEDRLILVDFGLFDSLGARHGFIQYAFKYANQLQSLQDMLVPMRFRRSVARRVFNVDVGHLPHKRSAEYMEELRRKFKYRKSYNIGSGRIQSDDKESVGIVEDYWFSSRAGSKGTSVDVIDEAGNFADNLEDIKYFNKKLYQSMFIPLRRVFESEATYDYTDNSIEMDELRFRSFLDRLRVVYDSALTEMFKLYLISKGIEIPEDISVNLNFDDSYNQNKKIEIFEKSISLWQDAKELMGTMYSAETLINLVFDDSITDAISEGEKIKAELEEDSAFFRFHMAKSNDSEDY